MKNVLVFLIACILSTQAYPRGGGGFSGGRSGGFSSGRSSGYSSGRSSGGYSSGRSSGSSSTRSSGTSSGSSRSSGGSWFSRGTSRSTPTVSNTSRTTITRGGRTYYISHNNYGTGVGGHYWHDTWLSPMYFWLPWNIWHPHPIVYSNTTIIEHGQQEDKDKACSIPKCDPKKDKGCVDPKVSNDEFGGHSF